MLLKCPRHAPGLGAMFDNVVVCLPIVCPLVPKVSEPVYRCAQGADVSFASMHEGL